MLNAIPKQFTLTDEGVVLFQSDASNPLPGQPVGQIRKGAALLQPDIALAEEGLPVGVDKEAAAAKLKEWLPLHVHEVLQPLFMIKDEAQIQEPAREIADKLYEALGILPRAELETAINGLDEEGRRALRERKIRLGPVLVFLPLLNKPAAVRLRALLWNLWHDKPLPADVPPDGVTSISVADKQDVDPSYYRAIGYPVYGPRAIRVDMLDRLISAVYDSADKGVFKARHEMAEWLGCPIPDLYAVLEAMDHKKIHDPAEEQREEEIKKIEAEQTQAPEEPQTPEADSTPEEPAAEESKEEKEENKETQSTAQPQEKPELATFRLRKGKAYGKPPRKKPPHHAKKKPKKAHKPKRQPRKEQGERVISAKAKKKMEDSPFAVLKDLKVQNKE